MFVAMYSFAMGYLVRKLLEDKQNNHRHLRAGAITFLVLVVGIASTFLSGCQPVDRDCPSVFEKVNGSYFIDIDVN